MEPIEETTASPSQKDVMYLFPGALDPDDGHKFIGVDAPEVLLDTERRSVRIDSSLCEECRGSLEYFAYCVELFKSKKSKDSKADGLRPRDVVSHHQDLQSMRESMESGCHLCSFLVPLVRGPADPAEAQQFFSNVKIEMAWKLNVDESHGELKRGRLQFTMIDPRHARTRSNYRLLARLQLWPVPEYAHLFPDNIDQGNTEDSSMSLGDLGSDGDASSISNASVSDLSLSNHQSSEDMSSSSNSWTGADSVSPSSSWGPASTFSNSQSSSPNSTRSGSPISGDQDLGRRVWLQVSSTASSYSRELATEWFAECLKNEDGQHAECKHVAGDWLPTRLIDVRHGLEHQVLRLVSPEQCPEVFGVSKRYATLSHCWGEWGPKGIPALKTSNERQRFQEGISFADVPSTFRDAVEVASWFHSQSIKAQMIDPSNAENSPVAVD
ncbi:MAG: hypothetical protein Q9222_005507 [Ikaeria aurantiellina]